MSRQPQEANTVPFPRKPELLSHIVTKIQGSTTQKGMLPHSGHTSFLPRSAPSQTRSNRAHHHGHLTPSWEAFKRQLHTHCQPRLPPAVCPCTCISPYTCSVQAAPRGESQVSPVLHHNPLLTTALCTGAAQKCHRVREQMDK